MLHIVMDTIIVIIFFVLALVQFIKLVFLLFKSKFMQPVKIIAGDTGKIEMACYYSITGAMTTYLIFSKIKSIINGPLGFHEFVSIILMVMLFCVTVSQIIKLIYLLFKPRFMQKIRWIADYVPTKTQMVSFHILAIGVAVYVVYIKIVHIGGGGASHF